MSDQALIIGGPEKLPAFAINDSALAVRDAALANAALIGKVCNADQNNAAVRAQIELKSVAQSFEKARKKLKEPIIEAGRQLDRAVASALVDVEKELGRIENLTRDFQLAEARRIREEQEAQARELARIEAEKQAELRRIADEQARVEREAREAREAAERAAREATNKAQREAAAKAMAEAEAARKAADQAKAKADAEAQIATERAQAAAAAEAKPIVAQRSFGQRITTDWEITVTNPYELAKFHPDCVKIEPLMTPIKQALNQGIAVKGVRAEKITKSNVRASGNLIEV